MTDAVAADAFVGPALLIEDDQPYLEAAADLGCDLAALKAVAEVESRGEPFLPDGRPPILFERHVFSRRTDGRHDAAHPDISNPSAGGYKGGPAEYARLARAAALDRPRALESASWGEFQIMGFNHRICGFPAVEAFVAAMCESQALQLDAFVAFVRGARLDRHLRARDWTAFARGYNGPGFRRNAYARRMAEAYRRHSAAAGDGFRVETLRDLQAALNHLGANAGRADGLMGPKTAAAIRRFQVRTRLPETGEPTPALMQAVQAVYFAMGGLEARPVA